MKKLLLSFCLLCFGTLAFAQKVINDPNIEVRKVGSFSGVSVSGGIDLDLSYGDEAVAGRATTLSVEAHGGSDFKGYDLTTEICSLEASGGSDIEVTANKELSARANGASDIHYKGQPNVKEAKASGASSVKSRS